jgi:hypothetical protein
MPEAPRALAAIVWAGEAPVGLMLVKDGSLVVFAWSNGRPAYRCRHGYTSSASPDPDRPKNTYVREDQILPHLAALAILLASPAGKSARGNRGLAQLTGQASTAALIDQLRAGGTILTYDPDGRALRAGGHDTPPVIIGKNAACTHSHQHGERRTA